MKREYDPNSCVWTLEVCEDGEGFYIQLSDEILERAGWHIGDELLWERGPGDTWTLRKKP